jgi:hypothetical protein
MTTARFSEWIAKDGRDHGLTLRFSFPPYPVMGMPKSVLRKYVEGNDPISGRPLMQEVIDALTKPLTPEELNQAASRQERHPRLLPKDTEENLQYLFVENGWTDGLPIILPTEERVGEMLTGTGADPQEVVGRMTVTTHEEKWEYTVEQVAAIAVMAGARPEHLPVLLAIASTHTPIVPSSTTSFAGMILVNGPIRHEIGMNCGAGALSPFNVANSVIGRAALLMTICFGNAKLGDTFWASTGHNLNYNNMCCAENEEQSPWEPFHVQHGFKPEESVVTLFRGWNLINMGLGDAKEMGRMAKNLPSMGSSVVFIVDPLVAKNLKAEGHNHPREFAQWLTEDVTTTAKQFWKESMHAGRAKNLADAGVEPFASWAKLPDDAPIRPFRSPDSIKTIVVGGETNPLWITTDFSISATASIDRWIPKDGVRKDKRPYRLPAALTISEEACGYERSTEAALNEVQEAVIAK